MRPRCAGTLGKDKLRGEGEVAGGWRWEGGGLLLNDKDWKKLAEVPEI